MVSSRPALRRFISLLPIALALCVLPVATGVAPERDLQGRVVDFATGRPLSGIVVAAAAANADFAKMLDGDRLLGSELGIVTAVTGADGSFVLPMPRGEHFLFDAFGESQAHVTFHGLFAVGSDLGAVRLIRPTRDERTALEKLNRFRVAPGGWGGYGAQTSLVFDENLMESARFWAAQEVRAGRIGHTCSALGNPPNCIEFNAFFHELAGVPSEWFAAQNAAVGDVSSWEEPNRLFEIEGQRCAPPYDWRDCGYSAEVGHFVNIMAASRWIGLGAESAQDSGVYYAMNLI
jgi:hypothetical protein